MVVVGGVFFLCLLVLPNEQCTSAAVDEEYRNALQRVIHGIVIEVVWMKAQAALLLARCGNN